MDPIVFGVAGVLGAGLLVWRRRQRWTQMAFRIRDTRAAITRPCPYRVADDGDRELVGLLVAASETEAALRGLGFTHAGDLVATRSNGATQVVRALLDPAHPTCALISMWPNRPTAVRVWLESYTDDGERVTTIGPSPPMVALPPTLRRQRLDADTRWADVVARHRAFTTDATLHAVPDLPALQAELERVHEVMIVWREAQPEGELLEADLRALLGYEYREHGPPLLARLGATLPTARARRARR